MKKRKVFVHRTLALLLAAVMTVTAAPQAVICSYAQEQEIADGSAADDSGTDEALSADTPSDTEQVTDGDETGSPAETITDDPASDEEEDVDDPVSDEEEPAGDPVSDEEKTGDDPASDANTEEETGDDPASDADTEEEAGDDPVSDADTEETVDGQAVDENAEEAADVWKFSFTSSLEEMPCISPVTVGEDGIEYGEAVYETDTDYFVQQGMTVCFAVSAYEEADGIRVSVNGQQLVEMRAGEDGYYEYTPEADTVFMIEEDPLDLAAEYDEIALNDLAAMETETDPPVMSFAVRELVPADEGYTEGKELTRSDNGKSETSYQYNVRAGKKYQISQYADGVRMLPDETTLRNGFARNEENKTVELTVPENAKPGNSYTYQIMYKSENKAVKVTMKFVVTVPISSVQKMTYKTDEVERDVDSRTSSLVFQAVAEGSRINSAYIDTTGVRLEVVYYEGISNDAMSAQLLQQGKGRMQITLDIGPDVQPGTKLGELRLYNSEEAPESANYYIPGGTYIIKAREPKVLKETQPTAKITYSDDVSFTLEVSSSTDILQPLVGKLYYKVEMTPKGDKISESVRAATQNPVFFPREIPDYSIDEETGEVIYEEIVQKQVIYVDSEEKRGLIGEEDITEYDVTVSIVQTGDPEELTPANANVAGKVRFESLKADLSDRTKASRFETKLTLKKGTTKIYTTQQDVAAATTVFQSATNNRLVTVADITQGISEEEKLSVRFADDKIYVSASGSTRLGKHTISVVPWGLATMYQPESTLTVTVEKGIEKIELTAPGSVYKQSTKAATLQVKITYNPEDTAPKAKKVKWSIVDESGEPLTQDNSELYGLVSVNSSGKVSINKKLSTEDGASYSFCVMASANDFTGNTVTGITQPITITGEAAAYETLALVDADGKVIATNDQTADMTTDRLQGVRLAALAAKAQIGDTVKPVQEIAVQDLTNVKSSNKAVVLQTEEDRITLRAVKPANKVKLQATLADGSKKSKTLVLNVKAAEPDQLALSVGLESGSAINQSGDSYATEMTFSGTVNTRLKLCVMQKTGTAAFDRLYAYTNHTVKASGGKLIASDVAAGEYTLIVTAATATVTLKNTAKKITETYKITNSNYSSEKAPKVSIEPKTDKTVKAGQLNAGDTRTISYKLGGSYAYQGRSVKVEMSAADEVKKADAYRAFRDACNEEDTVVSVSDGGFQLTFGDGNIPAGSYKLTLTFGTAGAGGSITADAKPVTLTLKAAAPKKVKGSYKAASSYKILKKPGESVVLTGSGKQIKKAAEYSALLGSNVKGVENKFREYFELEKGKDEQGQDVAKLKLKNTLTQAQIDAIAKDDLTGYVTYTVAYGDDGYGNPMVETKTVKITVKLKDK